MLHRLVQSLRFEREAFVWMDLDDRATGDGLILVVVTQVLLLLGNGASLFGLVLDLDAVLGSLLSAVVFWLVFSGIAYAVAVHLLGGRISYATVLRIAGFAYPTLLLLLFTERFLPAVPLVPFLAGAIWFLAIVAQGIHYVADLPLGRAAGAAVGGIVGWVIVVRILSGGLFF